METGTAKAPGDIAKLFVQAWNERDAGGIAELFEEDADFVNVVGLWWENREDIRRAHAYGLQVIFNRSELKLGRVKVKNLTDTNAIVHARMQLSGQTPKEQTSAGMRHNQFLFVVRKHDNRWLCVSAQNTDIVIGAETHIRNQQGELMPADYRSQSRIQTLGL
ncbi:MAG: SgcJ/EcaC family oxidoreductase [Pseudosphingobacterium sp.]|nr:SgcJ/EcaC family oxidoreductase [Pseudosphingobacterium sp.]